MINKPLFRFAIGTPVALWQILFFYVPIGILLFSAFVHINPLFDTLSLSFDSFTPLLTTPYISTILFTILTSTFTALLSVVIAFPLAYFIAFKSGKLRYFFLFFLILPFWTNFLLHVYAWVFILEDHGFLNKFLLSLHVIKEPIHFFNSLFSIILMQIYVYLPFTILPLYSSLERFNRSILEASLNLGASWRQTFFRVLFPLTLPAVRTGFCLVIIPCFGEFIIPELMGGDKIYFVGNVIAQFIQGESSTGLAAAFTLLSLLCLVATLWGYNRLFHLVFPTFGKRS